MKYTESGSVLIQEERQRQISAEGFTHEHDRNNSECELIQASQYYSTCALNQIRKTLLPEKIIRDELFPSNWDEKFAKPSDPIRNLIKAGALIAAEIDRLRLQEEENA